ncbi:hypothetical protein OG897_07715 [Streptomyces sp. NBC_00237]|uniref:hypothetical protein n=1 Tax=Streptomyces sp. NBC_00237 TaxID=2975687 RepID=UPI00224F28F3|nr:hypothetical protein [Streptomyces sp. NBC_00237]MCX5201341.1 hypothetical protein [Streptomyces sp. NBC_00237]
MADRTGIPAAAVGGYAIDEITGEVGKVEEITAAYVLLGPIGGGQSWQAEPGRVRPVTVEERLSAGVRVANARMFDPREVGGGWT